MILFITGVTGFLGGELLVELAARSDISKLYCLLRAKDQTEAMERLHKIFRLHEDFFPSEKVIPIIGDLSDPLLSQQLKTHIPLQQVNYIIHAAANTSFSKIYDQMVEQVNIGGTRQILEWASTLPHLSLFTYVGTATICGTAIQDQLVKEEWSPNIQARHLVKYSYTKMKGELMLAEFLPEEKILVVRPSIVMGDSRPWVPRSYVILWALATLNELRLFPANAHSKMDIIPIDYATQAIISLVFHPARKYRVYHISSGADSATTPDLVTGCVEPLFPDKPSFRFVHRSVLSDLKKWTKGKERIPVQHPLYPYQDYLTYWKQHFGDTTLLRILFFALEPYIDFIELGQVFDNSRLLEDTSLGPSPAAHVYLQSTAGHIESINVFEGAIDP